MPLGNEFVAIANEEFAAILIVKSLTSNILPEASLILRVKAKVPARVGFPVIVSELRVKPEGRLLTTAQVTDCVGSVVKSKHE